MPDTPWLPEFLRDGVVVVPEVMEAEAVDALRDAFEAAEATAQRGGAVFAARRALGIPAIRVWAEGGGLALARTVLGDAAQPVRGILFDKPPEANWPVAWHQDVTIAVRERAEVEGYGPWSLKAGVPHVQPPARVLDRMVTVRLHLDDCPASNGALRVIPASHRAGTLDHAAIRSASGDEAVTCEARAGDAVLMRPLLLHSSSPAEAPRHRRVVHVEYAVGDLDGGLRWAVDA